MNKFVIEAQLLETLLSIILNAIHPSTSTSAINNLIQKVKDSIVPFVEPQASAAPAEPESNATA